MNIIDGKSISKQIKEEITAEVAKRKAEGKKVPHLAAILVGHDGGSEAYMANKVKSCEEVGFKSSLFRFEGDVTEEELLSCIQKVNENDDIDGLIIQLPLPKHISEHKIIEAVDCSKDVDGFHPANVGRISLEMSGLFPATAVGIIELIRRYNIETDGKHCVVLGRSHIVGKPVAQLLLQKSYPGNCTVTVCHSHTPNIKDICLQADIIVAALGMPEFVKADMVKEGAVVIDVGTTRVKDESTKSGHRLVGDVAFDEVAPKTSYITPVPGGVGPMTIVALMQNTLLATSRKD